MEEHAVTTNRPSYVFVGLAGETAPGRPVKSGLYRLVLGDDRWELVTRGLPEAPAIRRRPRSSGTPAATDRVRMLAQKDPTRDWGAGPRRLRRRSAKPRTLASHKTELRHSAEWQTRPSALLVSASAQGGAPFVALVAST